MEYKNTLLMPKTEFPMRGNLPKREPAIQIKDVLLYVLVLFRKYSFQPIFLALQ
ncbi:hypothetical protein ACT4UM_21825, partial [Bacillus sp. SS-TM]